MPRTPLLVLLLAASGCVGGAQAQDPQEAEPSVARSTVDVTAVPVTGPSPAALALSRGDFGAAAWLPSAGADEEAYIHARVALAEGRLDAASGHLRALPSDTRALEVAWRLAHAHREPARIATAAAAWCAGGDMSGRSCADAELYAGLESRPTLDLPGRVEVALAPDAPVPAIAALAGTLSVGTVVDSGASQTVISRGLAEALGLSTTKAGFPVGVAMGAGQADARLAILPELSLGEARVRDLPVLVMDMPELDAVGISVVLSPHQALDGSVVTLDLAGDRLVMEPASEVRPPSGGIDLPYYLVGFDLVVPARIAGGAAALFAVDTGMTGTWASAGWYAAESPLITTPASSDGSTPASSEASVRVSGAGGSAVLALAPVAAVTLGQRTFAPAPGLITELFKPDAVQIAGLLGNGLWEGGSVRIDTARRRVLIAPSAALVAEGGNEDGRRDVPAALDLP